MRYVFGDYALDARRHELRRGGTPIKVRPQVFDVLAYLIAHRERVVAKQELLEQLTSSLEGERKPVTVRCCALANATGLAETLGPDAMHGLMRGFLDLAQHEIRRYKGTITQYLGDGFVALFGAPIAYEDHARRGVLAAVDLQRRLREHGPRLGHTASEALAVGIGLHTRSVVAGGMEDGRGLFTAVGPTTPWA
jgi:class 3 adenylate cyclase